jgi:epoxyqueuosine reductase
MKKEDLKNFAKEAGADLIGIAGIERFKEVNPRHHPSSIFPECNSVLLVGRRITRGTLRGIEEGTQMDDYSRYGAVWLDNRFLALTTFRIAEFLEDNKWEAVPLQNLPSQTPAMGVAVRENTPAPNVMVDIEDAAVRAGLGEWSYARFFLTPRFGTRQRFQMILTDAPLEPDPLLKMPICDRAAEHKDFCPLGAINTGKEEILDVCGKKMKVAEIDYDKCRNCKNGAMTNIYHPAGLPDRIAAACGRNCMDYLEKNNRIENTFRNPFRKRTPWTILETSKIIKGGK